MTSTDLNQTTKTEMSSIVKNFSVTAKELDSPTAEENIYDNPNATTYISYYKEIPELKSATDSLVIWSVGKGWTADLWNTSVLNHISGNGKQNFQQIMRNHLTMKKINGDAYIHIIRDENDQLLNLKNLSPARMKTITDDKGIIIRYEQLDLSGRNVIHKFEPIEILHSMNEPVGDEIHGVSVIEACKKIIDSRNEILDDLRRVMHRSTIRVMYVDEDNTSRINQIRKQYAEAIKKGELIIIPAKRNEAEIVDYVAPPAEIYLSYIRYLEDFFYRALRIPKAIMGGTTEAAQTDNKMGYMTFDPIYSVEQLELEADLWNQAGIKLDFNRPAQLGGLMNENEAKNTGQMGMQRNEVNPEAEE